MLRIEYHHTLVVRFCQFHDGTVRGKEQCYLNSSIINNNSILKADMILDIGIYEATIEEQSRAEIKAYN